jgi:hypothetical protein
MKEIERETKKIKNRILLYSLIFIGASTIFSFVFPDAQESFLNTGFIFSIVLINVISSLMVDYIDFRFSKIKK